MCLVDVLTSEPAPCTTARGAFQAACDGELLATCYMKLGNWKLADINEARPASERPLQVQSVLNAFQAATKSKPRQVQCVALVGPN